MEIVTSKQTKTHSKGNKKKYTYFHFNCCDSRWNHFSQFITDSDAKGYPLDGAVHEYSAERAFAHLKEFAKKPHPIGSEEHDRVRDYLIQSLEELGLEPEIQKNPSVYTTPGFPWILRAETVENIIAKIEGTHSTKSIMLVAHYDSVPGAAGAADDGAGASAILETVRALKEGKALQSDVIILLTDGEETWNAWGKCLCKRTSLGKGCRISIKL